VDNFSGVMLGQQHSTAVFDWYQGSAFVDVNTLRGVLSEAAVGAEWEDLERVPHGYGYGFRLSDTDGRVADVWAGGSHENPHFVASGPTAQIVCDLLRSELPGQHAVSRADPCIDYATPGAYDVLQAVAIEVAKEQRVKVGTAGDHLLTMEGRTLYLGAPSSHVRLRLYDKAHELRAKFANMPDVLETIPDELARLEGQIRPKTPDAKRLAATASPVEMFGSAAWMRVLLGKVAGLEIEPFQAGPVWRKSDDDRAYAAMLSQYGNLLQRIRDQLGSAECVGLQIFDDLAALRHKRARGG
jgi:hypothetical protein